MSQQAVGKFLKGLDEDETLRKHFIAAVAEDASTAASVVAFAKKHGFDFTEEELEKASQSVSATESGELSDNQLESVAGGIIIVGGSFSTTLLRRISTSSIYNIQKVYE